jgi:hypothetical protein
MVSSLALIAFGSWFAISAWRDLRKHGGHGPSHSHDFPHLHGSEQGHDHDGHDHGEHDHDEHDYEMAPEDDPLYAPLRDETAVIIRHVHAHRHGRGSVHRHWHDHTPALLFHRLCFCRPDIAYGVAWSSIPPALRGRALCRWTKVEHIRNRKEQYCDVHGQME